MSSFDKVRASAHEHLEQCCQTLCNAHIVKGYVKLLEHRLGITDKPKRCKDTIDMFEDEHPDES